MTPPPADDGPELAVFEAAFAPPPPGATATRRAPVPADERATAECELASFVGAFAPPEAGAKATRAADRR